MSLVCHQFTDLNLTGRQVHFPFFFSRQYNFIRIPTFLVPWPLHESSRYTVHSARMIHLGKSRMSSSISHIDVPSSFRPLLEVDYAFETIDPQIRRHRSLATSPFQFLSYACPLRPFSTALFVRHVQTIVSVYINIVYTIFSQRSFSPRPLAPVASNASIARMTTIHAHRSSPGV